MPYNLGIGFLLASLLHSAMDGAGNYINKGRNHAYPLHVALAYVAMRM